MFVKWCQSVAVIHSYCYIVHEIISEAVSIQLCFIICICSNGSVCQINEWQGQWGMENIKERILNTHTYIYILSFLFSLFVVTLTFNGRQVPSVTLLSEPAQLNCWLSVKLEGHKWQWNQWLTQLRGKSVNKDIKLTFCAWCSTKF